MSDIQKEAEFREKVYLAIEKLKEANVLLLEALQIHAKGDADFSDLYIVSVREASDKISKIPRLL